MPSISIRRVYDPVSRDGARILVDRIWPRGLTKRSAHINRWIRSLAPSTALRKWFGHKPARWPEFRRRYRAELRTHRAELRQLRMLAQRRHVTLVYSARDTAHNQAVVLREVLMRGLRRGISGRKRAASRHFTRTTIHPRRRAATPHRHH
ncbi:MAG: DUF488 family protein [Alphaproteobacteria bacterium]|nr:DUF488 family protein [Alphaproteobacteria bacterium]